MRQVGHNDHRPPEAKLIERWRTNPPGGRPRIGVGTAVARLAELGGPKMHQSTWYRIEQGGGTSDPAVYNQQIAGMCLVVGIPPEQLEAIGRTEAAAILRERIHRRQLTEQAQAKLAALSDTIRTRLEHAIRQIIEGPFPDDDKQHMIDDLLARVAARFDTAVGPADGRPTDR